MAWKRGLCRYCKTRELVCPAGGCRSCTRRQAQARPSDRSRPPVLLTLLREDAERLGLGNQQVLPVTIAHEGRQLTLEAMVDVCGRLGGLEED